MRRNILILYGADIGTGSVVAEQSVVMKNERLSPDTYYEGFPIRPSQPKSSVNNLVQRIVVRDTQTLEELKV